jgi:hypothetical protein
MNHIVLTQFNRTNLAQPDAKKINLFCRIDRDPLSNENPHMFKLRTLFLVSLMVFLNACQCQTKPGVDGGQPGGGTNRDAGSGGSSGGGSATGAGGSSNLGGGAEPFDAGDGTTTGGLDPGGFRLDAGADGTGDGVKLNPAGHVVLNSGSNQFYFMWIANNSAGWVSKYDTRTGKEVGRYFSVIPKDCSNSPMGPPCAGGQVHQLKATMSYNPSRTAIDIYGDMWVANRALGLQGSVTKIANDVSSCIDRNGNGTIETSRDLNNDGEISTAAAAGEMIVPSDPANPNTYDECVLFTKPVGRVAVGGEVAARALAISAGIEGGAGDVWVGLWHEQKMQKMNSLNGELLPVNQLGDMSIALPFGPYGCIVDRLQRLWVVEPGIGRLALIDTQTGALLDSNINTNLCGAYGLGIDSKNRLWIPGWTKGAKACRYDRTTQTWTLFDFSAAIGSTGVPFTWGRGIAVDAQGQVYMSGYGANVSQLIRFDSETGAIIPFGANQFIELSDAQTSAAVGVGLDGDGHPWVNNSSGNVSKVDKATGAITRTKQQPPGLYTYSDFTGYQLRNFTAPRGVYRKDFEACDPDNEWRTLSWVATTPPNTQIQVFVKVATSRALLDSASAQKFGPYTSSPIDLVAAGVPKTQFLRLEFNLRSTDGMTTPVLKDFSLVWACNGIK